MSLHDVGTVLVAVLITFVPGAAFLAACRTWSLYWLAVAPAVTCGIAMAVSSLCALLGVPYGVSALSIATCSLVLVAVIRWVRSGTRPRSALTGWKYPHVTVAAGLVGGVLVLLAVVACGLAWLRGMGSIAMIPQEHDSVVHTLLTSYIERTGNGAPWQVLPTDLAGQAGQPMHYPDGLHLLAAVTGSVTGGAIAGWNGIVVAFTAIVWPVSISAFGFYAARRARLGRAESSLVAGLTAVSAAGLHRPMFLLHHVGGMTPNAATLALAPAVVTVLLITARPRVGSALAIGVACAGLVAIHPSAVVTVGLTVLAWWVGELLSRGGLDFVRRQVIALAPALVIAAVVSLPALAPVLGRANKVVDFPPELGGQDPQSAIGHVLGVVYEGFPGDVVPLGASQVVLMILMMAGIAAVLVRHRPLGLVTAWVAWALVALSMFISPGVGKETLITQFFYNATFRVSSHLALFVPVLAALGMLLPVVAVASRLRWVPARRPRWSVLVAVAVLATGYTWGPISSYLRINEATVASRYSDPATFTRVSQDDLAAMNWLSPRIAPGQRVLNSANDGSSYLYVLHGIPIVNVATLGSTAWPVTYRLLSSFNRYPNDPVIRHMLLNTHVRWVYVDSSAPTISAAGAPAAWTTGNYDLAPGLRDLHQLPALDLRFRSGTVSVYELDVEALRHMPLPPSSSGSTPLPVPPPLRKGP